MADQRPTSTRGITIEGTGGNPSLEALREFVDAAISDGFLPETRVNLTYATGQRGEPNGTWRLTAEERRHV